MPFPIKHKISVTQLARITDYSVPHAYNLVNGHRPITWRAAEKLASLTGITASWWMRATRKEVSKTLVDSDTWKWSSTKIERKKA
jgi:plasmid maintenance system antidote protein VapI